MAQHFPARGGIDPLGDEGREIRCLPEQVGGEPDLVIGEGNIRGFPIDLGDDGFAAIRDLDGDRTGAIRYFSAFTDLEHSLPPGLAKNLRRGKPLPPGWQKKVQGGYVIEDDYNEYFHPLEYSLFPNLEVVPDTRLYLYGNRIVRVYEPRREEIDMIEVPTIRFD